MPFSFCPTIFQAIHDTTKSLITSASDRETLRKSGETGQREIGKLKLQLHEKDQEKRSLQDRLSKERTKLETQA
jgi:hypothetical protein